ncbi:hypothetical protein M5K25_021019 [Dendrobium thyrsiflorum]|uniref:Pentatricopeptide repeat-containing protein n=1 Tax=Dendrobium thyrsiflorum TaxID=117978 RepID=A0ABD0UBE4_DENTH
MVDLLCRAGLLNEAKELIELNKGMEFSVPMWGALLEASARLGNISMGEYTAKHLIELDQNDTRCYVSLSNLYSREGRWEDAARIRKLMSFCRMEKVPSCSSVEVGSAVNEFSVGRGLNSIDEMEESTFFRIIWGKEEMFDPTLQQHKMLIGIGMIKD